MFRQPVLVFASTAETLAQAHSRALSRGLRFSIFTDELFQTGDDIGNRAAVRAVPTEKLALAGLAVHGPKNAVDKILKGAQLHG
ncbi:Protein of unknown function [Amycolatopsis rubida]|uniref:DUF2000 domain-containing protein n=1 Tax=Amycolatopsis rubida TaxID=112413 RepID=A0A1I5Y4F9_9PSEU|nr:Protein of unknown function [Amycolatopsis rubida]